MQTDTNDQDVFSADFGLDSDEERNIQVKEEEREKRTFQSEKEFIEQKQNWTAKVETREELLKAVSKLFPPKTKFDVLTLKSAAELLYFSRDYEDALKVGEQVLEVAMNEDTYIGSSDKAEVETLVERCRQKLAVRSAEESHVISNQGV